MMKLNGFLGGDEYATTYTYDAVGRVASMRNALGRTMEYCYDETGNVVEMKDYAGNVTKNTYDDTGRLESFDNGFGKTLVWIFFFGEEMMCCKFYLI